jgi:hypothetical protein
VCHHREEGARNARQWPRHGWRHGRHDVIPRINFFIALYVFPLLAIRLQGNFYW